MLDGYEIVLDAVSGAWELPEKLTVSQWADKHRVLPKKGAAEPGPWRTSRTPYLREIMDVLSDDHPATDATFMAASQVGKTEILLNWIAYTIAHAPSPMLCVQPTVDTATKYSKQRISPMIELAPSLLEKIPPARSRDSGNTTLVKEYPAGILIMTGANSASSLASMPIKKLALDETDRYPQDVDDEGDPIALAEQRTVTYMRAKRYKCSTPGRAETSHIAKEYEDSSQAQYHVPCPHCRGLQVLKFEHLFWEKTEDEGGNKTHHPETTVYMCQICGEAIEERHKTWMLAEENGAKWVHRHPERKHLGYHINALYSPIGLGLSWAGIAEKFLEAVRDPAKLQAFVNLQKGEPYEDHSDRLKGSDLKERAEEWLMRTIPPGILVLTLGVDVQKDRLELHLIGWGENERSATIDFVALYGDPEKQEVWNELTEYRRKPVRNAFGVDLRVSMTAIDSGYLTHRVYNYGRQHRHDNVIVVKGAKDTGRPILGRPTKQDIKNDKGIAQKNGVQLWTVGGDTAKDALFARLAGDVVIEGGAEMLAPPEQRMVRFPAGLDEEYYNQIASEVYDERRGRWVKIRARNEALDTRVYAHAAACHPRVRIHRLQSADWDRLRSLLEPRINDLFSAPVEVPEQEKEAAPEPQQEVQQEVQETRQPEPAPAPEQTSLPGSDWLSGTDNYWD